MKKQALEEIERQPAALREKIEEMRGVKADIHEALKGTQVREEKMAETRLISTLRENIRNVLKTGALPFSLKVVRSHSLGDFRGKFHPSKSKKGIKRSE